MIPILVRKGSNIYYTLTIDSKWAHKKNNSHVLEMWWCQLALLVGLISW